MPRSRWPGRLLRAGRWVFAIAVLGALVAVAFDNADALRDVDLDITWAWLIGAVPIGLAAGVVLPLGWRRLVAAYGVAIGRGAAVRVWCLSQTGRYLPTGLAGFAARRRWAAYVVGGSLAVFAVMLIPFLFTSLADLVSISQARRAAGLHTRRAPQRRMRLFLGGIHQRTSNSGH